MVGKGLKVPLGTCLDKGKDLLYGSSHEFGGIRHKGIGNHARPFLALVVEHCFPGVGQGRLTILRKASKGRAPSGLGLFYLLKGCNSSFACLSSI